MRTQPSLCNLPDVVLRNIFNEVGFKSIINLRKVCRDLRNRIDYIKPEANLLSFGIRVNDNRIRLTYLGIITTDVEKGERRFRDEIMYEKTMKSGRSAVRCNRSKKKIVNDDFMELALRHLQLILKFQKKNRKAVSFTNRTEYSNNFLRFLEMLKGFLAIENQLLKVDHFRINTNDQKSVIPALSLIDPQSIDSISITGENKKMLPMKFSEIVEMDHWKSAKSFSSNYKVTGVSAHNFCHFFGVNVTFKSISVEELLECKKIFENSTEHLFFQITYDTFEDREQFCEEMGPAVMIYEHLEWYFRMSTTDNDVLRIRLSHPIRTITFEREAVAYLPERAVIRD